MRKFELPGSLTIRVGKRPVSNRQIIIFKGFLIDYGLCLVRVHCIVSLRPANDVRHRNSFLLGMPASEKPPMPLRNDGSVSKVH
jgi:hypothetical protein